MIIYQLHGVSGEFEDHMNWIVGSYVRRERAEEEKAKQCRRIIQKNADVKVCANCPYMNSLLENEELAKIMEKYCDHSKIYYDDDGELICENYDDWFDDTEFYIDAVEVEE